MLVHLSDTLEVRSYFNRAQANNALTGAALDSLEKFLSRLINGPFKLRDEAEFVEHEAVIKGALACVANARPDDIRLTSQSLESLLVTAPEGQMLIYAAAESGSVARVLETVKVHRERREKLPTFKIQYQGETRNIGLERRLRTLLNANGLKQTLRASQYGASFTKIFEKSIVSYYTVLFAHAMFGDAARVERLLPLAKIFRSNMPIGRLPTEEGKRDVRWLMFSR
ncbi:MAG: hypothetical protein AAB554_04840 [Patescibacteria group bacterium]